MKLKKVLVIQLRQLGDILLTTPILQSLKSFDSNMEIHFLSHKMGKLVLQNNPHITKHITYDESNDSIMDDVRALQNLRNEQYDLALDFMSNPRSTLWTFLIGAKHSIGLDVGIRSFLFKERITRKQNENRYIVEEKHDFLRRIDIQMSSRLPQFFTKQVDDEWAAEYFKKFADQNYPLRFIFSPTHRRPARQWPKKFYADLCEKILTQYPTSSVFWIWGPGEKNYVEEIVSYLDPTKHGERSKIMETTTFSQMASIIKHANYFVANSNGPSHVAVAVGTPSFQIHGPTRGSAWCPNDNYHRFLQAKDQNISSISPDEVFKNIQKHLSELKTN